MSRIRFFRFALPTALLMLIVLLALALKERPRVHRQVEQSDHSSSRQARGLRVTEYDGSRVVMEAEARLIEERLPGQLHMEEIERFSVFRDAGSPLIVSADLGEVLGRVGRRRMEFERQVVVRDPEHGFTLTLPRLEVDEAAAEARSRGEVRLEADGYQGTASELLYPLDGRPVRLEPLELREEGGGRLVAASALLLDGLDDVELRGRVRLRRGEEEMSAGRLRLVRWPEGGLRRAEAQEAVSAQILLPGGPSRVRGARVELEWEAQAELSGAALEGQASLEQGDLRLLADRIELTRATGDVTWAVLAEGTVYLQGLADGGAAMLRSDELRAELGEGAGVRRAVAQGSVHAEAPRTTAEADRVEFDPGGSTGSVRLTADAPRKARLARERVRLAAESILTDPKGENLSAERNVEATLHRGDSTERAGQNSGIFVLDEPVHFVAEQMESSLFGDHVLFSGAVRGWQGVRNLSAELVLIEGGGQSLSARDSVVARLPRGREAAAAEADYLQISAERLDYEEDRGVAVFEGRVRAKMAEGWLETQRLEIEFSSLGGGLQEARAEGRVIVEFRDLDEREDPRIVSGKADRLAYLPQSQTIRLFGDKEPAAVRRLGGQGGTTTGSVLRYQLDSGALEVDSGEQGPGRIRTAG